MRGRACGRPEIFQRLTEFTDIHAITLCYFVPFQYF